jgi:serine/threonine-protein kinase
MTVVGSRDVTGPHRRLVPARLLAALRPAPGAPTDLPSDVARESRRRIAIVSLLGVCAYATFLGLELSGFVGGVSLERRIDLAHDAAGLALCATLLSVALSSPLADRTVFVLSLAFEILLVSLISIAIPWASFVRTAHVSGLTWASVVIILFPLLVPTRPLTTLVVSSLGALAMPGGLWLLSARGLITAHAPEYWSSCVTGAVVTGFATVCANTLHGARQQLAAARTIGSYELLERLGQGGMGEVWKARHQLLARPAVIKRILPAALQAPLEERDAAIERFTREAQVTASLRSPHTVELFDFGASADGTLYYAMELLEGLNAEHFVYQFGALAPRRAVHWLRQMCHSLGEAHSRGLVHRDIKPANLFICRYGRDADFVKVLDFGLTRPVGPPGEAGLTAPGMRLGTPGYMAPEQVYGLPSDARTDLYALGCVGYWLLAGEKPFDAKSGAELMRMHVQATPPSLATAARPEVSPRLEAVILSCLAKDPADRPASADALGEALEQTVDATPWSAEDARAWWEVHLPEMGGKPA